MCIDIPTTRETYNFKVEKPSDNDMAKYAKYAQLYGCTINREDYHSSGKPKRLNDLLAPSIRDYSRLKPTSCFKSDDVYSVSLSPLSVASMKICIESVKCALRGPKSPSHIDFKKYENYAFARRSAFALQLASL